MNGGEFYIHREYQMISVVC